MILVLKNKKCFNFFLIIQKFISKYKFRCILYLYLLSLPLSYHPSTANHLYISVLCNYKCYIYHNIIPQCHTHHTTILHYYLQFITTSITSTTFITSTTMITTSDIMTCYFTNLFCVKIPI